MPVHQSSISGAQQIWRRIRFSLSSSDIPTLMNGQRYYLLRSNSDNPTPRPRSMNYHHRNAGASNPDRRAPEAISQLMESSEVGGRIRRSRSENSMTIGEIGRLVRTGPVLRQPEITLRPVERRDLSATQILYRALRNVTEATVDAGIRSLIAGWCTGIVLKMVSGVPRTAGVAAITGALYSILKNGTSYGLNFGLLLYENNNVANALQRARNRNRTDDETLDILTSFLAAQINIHSVNPDFYIRQPMLNIVSSIVSIGANRLARYHLPENFSVGRLLQR